MEQLHKAVVSLLLISILVFPWSSAQVYRSGGQPPPSPGGSYGSSPPAGGSYGGSPPPAGGSYGGSPPPAGGSYGGSSPPAGGSYGGSPPAGGNYGSSPSYGGGEMQMPQGGGGGYGGGGDYGGGYGGDYGGSPGPGGPPGPIGGFPPPPFGYGPLWGNPWFGLGNGLEAVVIIVVGAILIVIVFVVIIDFIKWMGNLAFDSKEVWFENKPPLQIPHKPGKPFKNAEESAREIHMSWDIVSNVLMSVLDALDKYEERHHNRTTTQISRL